MRASPAQGGNHSSNPNRRLAQCSVDTMLDVVPWYKGLPELERNVVRSELRTVALAAGEYLFRTGSRSPGWYGVVEGLVKWSSPGTDGRTLSLAGFSTGSWFGEATMIRRERFEYEVVALRPSRIVILPRDTCERLWNNNIEFTKALMTHLAQRVNWLMGCYTGNVLLDVDTTVARAVAAQLDAELHSGTNGRLKISQEEIASLCGVSRQRCNTAMTRLARAGVLQTHYGGLTVLDRQALYQHAKLSGKSEADHGPA
ncbi:Crp/Fnr family transcriptional regulator [Achromobacter deleyi]|uniref:Crp/Fnr family transcriptional regulator n=1 Tax=Achromobacter deleyi TaxID=1353891 RepID=UPI001F1A7F2E|nr:Crp/Fnr family transcriptional regulator [Achromobacter deleyi]UIP21619.1 Crp/Fnr family transcriptional regulator [Achromobacter deleyi]